MTNAFTINTIITSAKETVLKATAAVGSFYRSDFVQSVVKGVKQVTSRIVHHVKDNWKKIVLAGTSLGVASVIVSGVWSAVFAGGALYAMSRTAWFAYQDHKNGYEFSIIHALKDLVKQGIDGLLFSTVLAFGTLYGGFYLLVVLDYLWVLALKAWFYSAYFLVA